MKQFLAILVLISHINYSMFIPPSDGADQYDKNGVEIDDIGSLYEYIDERVLGNTDTTPGEEDDRGNSFFHIIKVDHNFKQQIAESLTRPAAETTKVCYPLLGTQKLPQIYADIAAPPPRA